MKYFLGLCLVLAGCAGQRVATQDRCYATNQAVAEARQAGWEIEKVPDNDFPVVQKMLAEDGNDPIAADSAYVAAMIPDKGEPVLILILSNRGCFVKAYAEQSTQ